MKKEQGFSLIELLIVVAIIAIIAAIAVPSMLTARMAANESGAIQGCRTVGSSQVAYAAVNNQTYATLADLVDSGFLDSRFDPTATGFNGYEYADHALTLPGEETIADTVAEGGFGIWSEPSGTGTGRYTYGIGPDQVVRYQATNTGEAPMCGLQACTAGDPIGTSKGAQ